MSNYSLKFDFFLKLVLSALVAVAVAAPSGYHAYSPLSLAYSQPEYHVSKIIEHVPTAVSHQSRVDYHSKPVITPIYAPVVKAIPQPAIAVHSAPIYQSVPVYHSDPWADVHAW